MTRVAAIDCGTNSIRLLVADHDPAAGTLTDRLHSDPELAAAYRAAHDAYVARRAELGDVPEIAGVSAGGMPGRVKCLHVHLGHSLAVGPGVNPFGDEVRELIEPWWAGGPCVP